MDADVRDFSESAPVFATLYPHGYHNLGVIQHLLILQMSLLLKLSGWCLIQTFDNM